MGGRIQAVLREINNEKIDILEWSEDPKVFIGNSLKPATINEVIINDTENREATVVVPDDQLSLAIGKAGQNVRLAVKLTNWKLDITSESDHNKKTNPQTEATTSEETTLAEKIKASAEESPSEIDDTNEKPEQTTETTNIDNENTSNDDDTNSDSPTEESSETVAESEETVTDPSNKESEEKEGVATES
tara:strand:- start:21684 stop:22253 length:570 start_codon:yes stop_codon:yes gene_type:complete